MMWQYMSDDSLYVYYCTFPSVLELNRSWQLQLKYTQTISHQQQVLLIFQRTQKPLALIECFTCTIRYQCYFIMCGDNEMLSEMHISLSLIDKTVGFLIALIKIAFPSSLIPLLNLSDWEFKTLILFLFSVL